MSFLERYRRISPHWQAASEASIGGSFDAAQLRWYEKLNAARLDTRAEVQVSLLLRNQGHGFVPTLSFAAPAFLSKSP
jgi:hypothetical protein